MGKITLLMLLLSAKLLAQDINVKIGSGSVTYLTGSTYNFTSIASGTTGTAVTFRIENTIAATTLNLTGTPKVVVSGTDDSLFTVNETATAATLNGVASTTFTVTFAPLTSGVKTASVSIDSNDPDEPTYVINLTATATVSAASTIAVATGYVYPLNILFANYQATDITNSASDIEIAKFTIKDGGATVDTDNLETTLTDITFTVDNPSYIRSIALYDGATEIGIEQDGAASVTFNNISLTAPDGGTKDFTVRVSFNEIVADNSRLKLTVTAATAAPATSVFASANAGGAATNNTTGDNNKLEVVATTVEFVQQPSDSDTFVSMSPAVTVSANDAFGNRDLDFTSAVILTTTGSYYTGNDANNNAVAGLASFPLIKHSIAGTNLVLTATSTGLVSTVSDNFDINSASASNNYFRSNGSGNWSTASNWQSSFDNATWVTATIAPTSASLKINIRSGHEITSNASVTADQILIDAGGSLVISGGTFTLANGAGTDLTSYGTITYSGGTFTQSGSTIALGSTAIYNHSIASATLTLPTIAWNAASTCNITGLNNTTAITAVNMGQTFGNLNWNNPSQSGYVSINNAAFKVLGTMGVGTTTSNTGNKICLSDSGSNNNAIKTLTVSGGEFCVAAGTGSTTLAVSNAINVTGGVFIASAGSGSSVTNVTNSLTISGTGKAIVINSSNSPNTAINLTRDLIIADTGALYLEAVSSSAGIAEVNVTRDFTCTANALPAIDFGTGSVTDNAVNLKRYFNKSGTGAFTTTSASPAKGFVFAGTAAQTLVYSGTNSSSTSYCVKNGASLTLSSDLTFGTDPGAVSVFTVQSGGKIDFGTKKITGNATLAQFNAEPGCTITTSNTGGLGGTAALGSLQSFGSADTTPANGRICLPAGVNYILKGSTTTPFPVGAGLTFGNPGSITTSANITSNMVSDLTVNSAITISSGTFKLNSSNNNLILNDATLTVAAAAVFDNGGENQILGSGTSPSILLNGKFTTRDLQGFVGTNSAIPAITPTLNAGSTVEYGLTGNQAVQSAPSYKNLILSGSGTKSPDGNCVVSTKITITSPAILDAGNFSMGGSGTALTMTGTALYKISGSGLKPDATGTYTLAAGSVIDFYGSSPIEIRVDTPVYGKITISGTNVSNNSLNTGIKFQAGSGFTVNNGGVFKFKNTDGFTGSTTTALSNAVAITPVLSTGSTIEYAGDAQFITPFTSGYKKLAISGTGIKTIPGTTEILVGDNLTVTASTLQIDADRLLTVTNGIVNSGGTIDIKNKGNLVQITAGIADTGNIKMTRTTRPVNSYDFVYWGSPVQGNVLSQIPSAFYQTYTWSLSGLLNGAWGYATTTTPGVGFITRASVQSTPTAYNFEFNGVPNNGNVVVNVNSYDNGATPAASGNTALLGNPYPSAISAALLVSGNSTILSGTLYFWTALTPFAANAYTINDYATWNATGGTGVKASSDISGTDTLKPTGKIAAGQGFFANIKNDGNITFTNAMRLRTTTDNGQFFRNADEVQDVAGSARVWLNLKNDTGAFRQLLVGYIEGATNDIDTAYDGRSVTGNSIDIYSLNAGENLVIQGRALPFTDSDVVPLGYRVTNAGPYKVEIDETDGLFSGSQGIYLEDTVLGLIHDLKAAPYNFTSEAGTFDSRFILRYTDEVLGVPDTASGSQVNIVANDKGFSIYSGKLDIKQVIVYDLLGRELLSAKADGKMYNTKYVTNATQPVIVKIQLENGAVVMKKVIL